MIKPDFEKIKAEYIWLDGTKPTAYIRSKTKILEKRIDLFEDVPIWGFDGSSTNQAEGHSSDCVLKPVKVYKDPIRGGDNIIVLSEVYTVDDEVHSSNNRASLRELVELYEYKNFICGIEQEYTFLKLDGTPYGFLESINMDKQGKYYCGVGADKIFGRELVEDHLDACLNAGLEIEGINCEVMPGQHEYQIGAKDALTVADDLIIARYLLERLGEKHSIVVTLAPKPAKGDWNGAGAHINFSTAEMMESNSVFENIIDKLKSKHFEHIAVYGAGIEERLTGAHETCKFDTFRCGVSDRGASIRIPWKTAKEGKGHLEDRRPCANIDPYEALAKLMSTIIE
ncbi:glutamine synthetase [Candidatus Woesearchaeota archaeon CG10_big_fil_rev_8_21_14_0_10_30_7]|nr:MAG: glutamine synthetase [Candidatus Woesearchaeota archaeon CG10_big_fil_rev_8_21_14_0_10_30_7]